MILSGGGGGADVEKLTSSFVCFFCLCSHCSSWRIDRSSCAYSRRNDIYQQCLVVEVAHTEQVGTEETTENYSDVCETTKELLTLEEKEWRKIVVVKEAFS